MLAALWPAITRLHFLCRLAPGIRNSLPGCRPHYVPSLLRDRPFSPQSTPGLPQALELTSCFISGGKVLKYIASLRISCDLCSSPDWGCFFWPRNSSSCPSSCLVLPPRPVPSPLAILLSPADASVQTPPESLGPVLSWAGEGTPSIESRHCFRSFLYFIHCIAHVNHLKNTKAEGPMTFLRAHKWW